MPTRRSGCPRLKELSFQKESQGSPSTTSSARCRCSCVEIALDLGWTSRSASRSARAVVHGKQSDSTNEVTALARTPQATVPWANPAVERSERRTGRRRRRRRRRQSPQRREGSRRCRDVRRRGTSPHTTCSPNSTRATHARGWSPTSCGDGSHEPRRRWLRWRRRPRGRPRVVWRGTGTQCCDRGNCTLEW